MKLKMNFSQKQLDDILHKHGYFATTIRRIQYHLRKNDYTVFAPIIPDSATIDDKKTIIDLAVNVGFDTVVIPWCEEYESLQKRSEAYTGGKLKVIINDA